MEIAQGEIVDTNCIHLCLSDENPRDELWKQSNESPSNVIWQWIVRKLPNKSGNQTEILGLELFFKKLENLI